jgi:hypothetical protein
MLIISKFFSKKRSPPSAKLLVEKTIVKITKTIFKSMKTAYATIKGIEVMRALRKGQASSFYYGQPQGEVCLINRVFGL